jgi:parvulin-like peptidyl-prolyl isomerase
MKVTVNGEEITKADIDAEVARLRTQYEHYMREQGGDPGDDQLYNWCRESLVEKALMRQAAESGVDRVTEDEIRFYHESHNDRFEGMKKKDAEKAIRDELRIQKLVGKIAEGAVVVMPAEIQKYYETNAERFTSPEQVRVSHIVKHVGGDSDKPTAYAAILNVQERLKKGESFESVAADNSDCPDKAGDLGYFSRGQMVEKFEDVVFNMPVGEVSDVFLTEFGYHVAKLVDRKPGGTVPFDQVSDSIQQQLDRENKSRAIEAYVDGLKESAEIKGIS